MRSEKQKHKNANDVCEIKHSLNSEQTNNFKKNYHKIKDQQSISTDAFCSFEIIQT